MMKHKTFLTVLSFLLVIAFASSTSAYTYECYSDTQCNNLVSGEFCYEDGSGSECINASTNPYTACSSVACTETNDCLGLGRQYCHSFYDVCLASAGMGEQCSFDGDCIQSGGALYCRLNICTPVSQNCNSNSDCPSPTTCVQGICRAKGTQGAECYAGSDCVSGICDSLLRVCSECDSLTGIEGDVDMPDGYFCNLQHIDTCQSSLLYPTFANLSGIESPTLEPLKDDGEECWDGKCCASNNCVNGYCVGAGSIPIYGDEISTFCQVYNRALTSEYIDGGSGVEIANATFFSEFFNISDLVVLEGGADKFSVRSTYDGDLILLAHLYSNSTGTACYVRQQGNEVAYDCIDGCTGTNRAINNAGDGYYNLDGTGKYNCQSDDFGLAIGSGSGQGNAVAVVGGFGKQGDDLFVDVIGGGLFGVWCGSGLGWYATTYGVLYTGNRLLCHTDANWVIDGQVLEPNNDIINSVKFSDLSGMAGATDLLNSTINVHDTETVNCCATDADCPTGFACSDQNICYFVQPAENTATIKITSGNPKLGTTDPTICPSEVVNLYAQLYDSNNKPIYPDGTITANVSTGTGTLDVEECDANDNPCLFVYTAPAGTSTEVVDIVFSGDTDYKEVAYKINLAVNSNCHYLKVTVSDALSKNKLANVVCTPTTGTAKNTNTDGIVQFFKLPSSQINITYSKSGYQSATGIFQIGDLDKSWYHDIYPNEDTSTLDEYDFPFEPPTNSSEAISGFKELTFGLLSSPLAIGLTIITFLFMIGVIKLLFESVL